MSAQEEIKTSEYEYDPTCWTIGQPPHLSDRQIAKIISCKALDMPLIDPDINGDTRRTYHFANDEYR